MEFSRPYICTTCCNHDNKYILVKYPLLKKKHFLELLCSVHVVTITTGFSYSNRSLLKKWHFLDLVCSAHIETITTGCSYSNRSLLKKWHFLDLICAIYVVIIRIEVFFVKSLLLAYSGPYMFCIGSNYYNWV